MVDALGVSTPHLVARERGGQRRGALRDDRGLVQAELCTLAFEIRGEPRHVSTHRVATGCKLTLQLSEIGARRFRADALSRRAPRARPALQWLLRVR